MYSHFDPTRTVVEGHRFCPGDDHDVKVDYSQFAEALQCPLLKSDDWVLVSPPPVAPWEVSWSHAPGLSEPLLGVSSGAVVSALPGEAGGEISSPSRSESSLATTPSASEQHTPRQSISEDLLDLSSPVCPCGEELLSLGSGQWGQACPSANVLAETVFASIGLRLSGRDPPIVDDEEITQLILQLDGLDVSEEQRTKRKALIAQLEKLAPVAASLPQLVVQMDRPDDFLCFSSPKAAAVEDFLDLIDLSSVSSVPLAAAQLAPLPGSCAATLTQRGSALSLDVLETPVPTSGTGSQFLWTDSSGSERVDRSELPRPTNPADFCVPVSEAQIDARSSTGTAAPARQQIFATDAEWKLGAGSFEPAMLNVVLDIPKLQGHWRTIYLKYIEPKRSVGYDEGRRRLDLNVGVLHRLAIQKRQRELECIRDPRSDHAHTARIVVGVHAQRAIGAGTRDFNRVSF